MIKELKPLSRSEDGGAIWETSAFLPPSVTAVGGNKLFILCERTGRSRVGKLNLKQYEITEAEV